jgi:ribosomal protein S18 acetylase RimI-like enzyme
VLTGVVADAERDDAALATAWLDGQLRGLGFWRRYAPPTHRPHADLEKLAVDPSWQRRRLGRGLMNELISAAEEAGIEVLTLDLGGDNHRAAAL